MAPLASTTHHQLHPSLTFPHQAQMPGGRPKKYFTPEEARQAHLISKAAYRQRNLEEERAKSRCRSMKAARIARNIKKEPQTVESGTQKTAKKGSVLNSNKTSTKTAVKTKKVTFPRDIDLVEAMRQIWQRLFNTSSPPDLDLYFPQRYQAQVSAVKEHGWDEIRGIMNERKTLLEDCEEGRHLAEIALQRVYGKSGKALEKANKIKEDMEGFRKKISSLLSCEDEFEILVNGMGIAEYEHIHNVKGLSWQGR
ncbi:hypothetical protein M422DRAFT_780860 [Sphaerobolus stellatus SS14]|uniref:Uncharacterized protein n=1 Tax=Sphaerobolus stellatus (strain SS14) TaxID=990650 RepID=A0A0C9UA97_SPHS4|nr:hypothetical protein M422DRAFT_780860 [Sphaerobolus stellatus SS14]